MCREAYLTLARLEPTGVHSSPNLCLQRGTLL
jgi:hypothetical protein